jgi:hypothetical protein
MKFQVLTAASMMFRAVFWIVLPSKIILHGSTTQKTALNTNYEAPKFQSLVCLKHTGLQLELNSDHQYTKCVKLTCKLIPTY